MGAAQGQGHSTTRARSTEHGERDTDYGLQISGYGLMLNSNTIASFGILVNLQLLHILPALLISN